MNPTVVNYSRLNRITLPIEDSWVNMTNFCLFIIFILFVIGVKKFKDKQSRI